LEPGAFDFPPVDAGERPAGRTAARRRARELSAELIDDAVNRARVRSAVGALADRSRISDEVIDELLPGASTEEEIVGPGGLLAQLTKRLVERAMEAELIEYLGYEPHQEPPGGAGDTRSGGTPKTLLTDHGPVRISTPRDRNGGFEPKIVRKGQRGFQGFDDKILALYSRGLSTRGIEAHLAEIYAGPAVRFARAGRPGPKRVPNRVPKQANPSSCNGSQFSERPGKRPHRGWMRATHNPNNN
jgi:hypothetical protein